MGVVTVCTEYSKERAGTAKGEVVAKHAQFICIGLLGLSCGTNLKQYIWCYSVQACSVQSRGDDDDGRERGGDLHG